jgi:nitroreductase
MDIGTAIKSRKSTRHYKKNTVPIRMIDKIIESGRKAPSVHNLKPWHFSTLNAKQKKMISNAMKKRAKIEFMFLNKVLAANADVIKKSPVAIALFNTACLSKRLKRLGADYKKKAEIWETQSIACCAENMLLEAESMGIASVFIGSVILCDSEIEDLLDTRYKLMAVIVFGYPKSKKTK